jgi:mono/diheme cytochrome c family protein
MSCRLLLASLALAGCGDATHPSMVPPDMAPSWPYPQAAAETQRTGDPQKGWDALITNGYVSCGIPYSLYSAAFGAAPENLRLPGRTGHNATLPYSQTAFVTKSGVEVVSANCLLCHAAVLNNQVVVGLGAHDGDFTTDQSQYIDAAEQLVTKPDEKLEMQKFASRIDAISPYTQTLTVGVNPADAIAAILFSHRDPKTLAWSDTPLLMPPPAIVVPVDVPPWWRMAKKNVMFYNASGRGDHARIMMTASTLCTDSVDEAQAIDAYFADVEAFITSLKPPAWPWTVDSGLAAQGKVVFDANCAECHGSYGDGGVFPNELVPVDDVGTDGTLSIGGTQFADRFVNWFNTSFYGQTARLDPQPVYIAPPLDGIWATAPYLHNGSVPTLAALLDSKSRPKYWTRDFADSTAYDQAAVGWKFTPVDHGQADETNAAAKVKIYDTTLLGYGNGGHQYGDALTDGDRAALLEYLKTL